MTISDWIAEFCRKPSAKDEAEALLLDLFEIEAQYDVWDWTSTKIGYVTIHSGDAIVHSSGELRICRKFTMSFWRDWNFYLNDRKLHGYHRRLAKRIYAELKTRDEERAALAELERVTKALKR